MQSDIAEQSGIASIIAIEYGRNYFDDSGLLPLYAHVKLRIAARRASPVHAWLRRRSSHAGWNADVHNAIELRVEQGSGFVIIGAHYHL